MSLTNANGESFVNSDNRGPTGIPSLFLTLGLVALVAPSAAAFPAGDDRVQDISRFVLSFGVELTTVAVVGDSAFVYGVGGVTVLDISNPENAVLRAHTNRRDTPMFASTTASSSIGSFMAVPPCRSTRSWSSASIPMARSMPIWMPSFRLSG